MPPNLRDHEAVDRRLDAEVGFSAVAIASRRRMPAMRIGTQHLVIGVIAIATASGSTRRGSTPEPAPAPAAGAAVLESNTRRADYIGPEACGECHAEKLAAWK